MSDTEFDKIWTLIGSLWPNAAAKKSKVDIAVWRKGLESYAMADVSAAIMEYAKKNKFFPDLADITKNLLGGYSADAGAAIIRTAKLYAKIRKLDVPEFETKDQAMAWFRETQEGCA